MPREILLLRGRRIQTISAMPWSESVLTPVVTAYSAFDDDLTAIR
jgi:hypothetical protein